GQTGEDQSARARHRLRHAPGQGRVRLSPVPPRQDREQEVRRDRRKGLRAGPQLQVDQRRPEQGRQRHGQRGPVGRRGRQALGGRERDRVEGLDPPVRYDFVIVGGGSAGCALANRLSADPSVSVLVLEAGRADWRWDVFIHMPAALMFPIGSRFYDWKYESEPEPHMNGRRVYHARGKVLGGSSSINGMIFQRGNPLDYERWASDPGMESWDYAHCLPYFKKMESCLADPDSDFRGGQGPLKLERGPAKGPLFEAFFEAVQQAGHPLTDDVNGYRQEGFAAFDRNLHRGRRLSAARAYLHPVRRRRNLTVRTRAFVERIVFDGKRATGVVCDGERIEAGEVIVCSGAINSPQLLQLSGVGPASLLEPLGIPVVHDLPGVGEHLQHH